MLVWESDDSYPSSKRSQLIRIKSVLDFGSHESAMSGLRQMKNLEPCDIQNKNLKFLMSQALSDISDLFWLGVSDYSISFTIHCSICY